MEGWIDKKKNNNQMDEVDVEDEQRDEEMENYEYKHNFRFEEQTGTYITTHQREVPETMRR